MEVFGTATVGSYRYASPHLQKVNHLFPNAFCLTGKAYHTNAVHTANPYR